ncbi:MAG: hypothetical protein ACFFBU_01100 [Promethearchaeota archaeon]
MTLEFVEESVEVDDLRISIAVSRLANGTLMLVTDREHRFGTIAIGVPTPFGELSPTATSCMVGTRFQAEVRAIADVAAQKLGGIVVVNFFLSQKNASKVASVLSVVRQVVLNLDSEETTAMNLE